MKRSSFTVTLSLCLSVCASFVPACDPRHDGGGTIEARDAAVRDATLGSRLCTDDRQAWLSRCSRTPVEGCERLTSPESAVAARAHIDIMLRVAPGLAELRFRHGPFVGRAVGEVLGSPEGRIAVVDLSVLIARSFAGCEDHAVLGRTVVTPQCDGEGGPVTSVEGAPCALLDHACGRGYFDASGGCCRASLTIAGAACESPAGTGACDLTGACAAGAPVSIDDVVAWAEVVPARSGPPRLESWSNDRGTVVRVEETWDLAALDEVPEQYATLGWAQVPPIAENTSRVVLARPSETIDGADGVLLSHSRVGTVSAFIHASLRATGSIDDVPEVVIITRPLDDVLFVGADGRTIPEEASLRIPCTAPSEAADGVRTLSTPLEGARCERLDGYLRVSAVGLSAALVPTSEARDVRPPGTLAPSRAPSGYLTTRDRPPGVPGVPGGPRACVLNTTRSCGCGTQQQRCVGGHWGPCGAGMEACNGCDDDRDGNVDEGGSSLCTDGVPCTVDACFRLRRGVAGGAACTSIRNPAGCRRGNCTRGVCLGLAGAGADSEDLDPRIRPLNDGNGCTWDESDVVCENADGCSCNGMARCDGTTAAANGLLWSGVSPIPAALATSLGTCRPRTPLEAEYPTNDARGTFQFCSLNGPPCPAGEFCVGGLCAPIRNGGCETNGNVCDLDQMCLEPDPSTSTCVLFNGTGGAALRSLQATILNLVSERSSDIDGRPVACVADVLGTALPPPPLNQLCRRDGSPCTEPDPTLPFCNPLTGSCQPELPVPGGATRPGETTSATIVFGPGPTVVPLTSNGCEGDALAPVGVVSCYREQCNSSGSCGSATADEACPAEIFDDPWCGAPFVCRGTAGSTPGVSGPVITPATWYPGTTSVLGCGRSGCIQRALGNDICWPAGEGPEGGCFNCQPAVTDDALTPRTFGPCGGTLPGGGPCGMCGPGGVCRPTSGTEC